MSANRTIQQISIGGWFQRTTLHLSEIYDFLKYAESPLDLESKKLKSLRKKINPLNLELHVGELDHITFSTEEGVDVVIYEDGLIVLSITQINNTIADEIAHLTNIYEKQISPGFSYLFSLGAPVPKELANIKTIYPYFIVFKNKSEDEVLSVFEELDEKVHYDIRKKGFDILRGDKLYVINDKQNTFDVNDFVAEVIFTREFKGQLHRYLNLHRIIWEKIADVKERGEIKGREIGPFRAQIEQYAKSINLIGARINQMDSYIATRGSIAHQHLSDSEFIDLIGYRYETLTNTLQYVKHIWTMTENYVQSAQKLFGDLQASATSKSIQSLTVVTSMGVGASLLGLFETSLPDINVYSIFYIAILAAIGFTVNKIMKWWGLSRYYGLNKDQHSIKE